MTTWNEFAEKANKDWDVRFGEAYWTTKDVPIRVKVQIRVPTNSLEPSKERIALAQSNKDVEFQALFISEEPVMYLDAREFANAWLDLWGEEVQLEILDGPPPNFTPPPQLEFTPELVKRFKSYKISGTELAPLWGQYIDYFDNYEFELNAGPRQNNDPKVKYQQEWVARNIHCPFCLHDDWAMTYAMKLGKPEQQWYDPDGLFYVLICPKCHRAVEALPRQLIK